MRINIDDILIAKPIKSLVLVIGLEKSFVGIAWLKNYWKTKYNMKLPRFFDTILVNFPSHDKIYEYPRYRKCIKRPLRQKKYKKLFKLERKGRAISQLAQRIKKNQETSKIFNELNIFDEFRDRFEEGELF